MNLVYNSYNGVELPALPTRENNACVYALLFYTVDGTVSLVFTDTPLSLGMLDPMRFDEDYRNWEAYTLSEGDEWVDKRSGYSNYDGVHLGEIIWADYPVLDPDGMPYLMGSEPLAIFAVTHTVHADLLDRGVRPRVDVMQGDQLTRRVEFLLTAGGVPWVPPKDTVAAISYVRPDGRGRVYDKMPDGLSAYTVKADKIRFTLLPEMLVVAGEVQATLRILRKSDEHLISTFLFEVVVEADPAYTAGEVEPDEGGIPKLAKLMVLTITQDVEGAYHADKPFAEVRAALDAGHSVVCCWDMGDGTVRSGQLTTDAESILVFTFHSLSGTDDYQIFKADEAVTHMAAEAEKKLVSVATVKNGASLTVTAGYDDGSTGTVVITLNADGDPVTVVKAGITCNLTWEGFE